MPRVAAMHRGPTTVLPRVTLAPSQEAGSRRSATIVAALNGSRLKHSYDRWLQTHALGIGRTADHYEEIATKSMCARRSPQRGDPQDRPGSIKEGGSLPRRAREQPARRSGTRWQARRSTLPQRTGCWSGSWPGGISRLMRCIVRASRIRVTRGEVRSDEDKEQGLPHAYHRACARCAR